MNLGHARRWQALRCVLQSTASGNLCNCRSAAQSSSSSPLSRVPAQQFSSPRGSRTRSPGAQILGSALFNPSSSLPATSSPRARRTRKASKSSAGRVCLLRANIHSEIKTRKAFEPDEVEVLMLGPHEALQLSRCLLSELQDARVDYLAIGMFHQALRDIVMPPHFGSVTQERIRRLPELQRSRPKNH